ncbi:hypothetical protein R3P38DRAFT_2778515 [Favolaschia claudopus]|uniref:Uncharacterized protein n=1 Tax=Favolaschia claudopus TaxID=2862362 RepID=A0AAW0BHB2_9AGAR
MFTEDKQGVDDYKTLAIRGTGRPFEWQDFISSLGGNEYEKLSLLMFSRLVGEQNGKENPNYFTSLLYSTGTTAEYCTSHASVFDARHQLKMEGGTRRCSKCRKYKIVSADTWKAKFGANGFYLTSNCRACCEASSAAIREKREKNGANKENISDETEDEKSDLSDSGDPRDHMASSSLEFLLTALGLEYHKFQSLIMDKFTSLAHIFCVTGTNLWWISSGSAHLAHGARPGALAQQIEGFLPTECYLSSREGDKRVFNMHRLGHPSPLNNSLQRVTREKAVKKLRRLIQTDQIRKMEGESIEKNLGQGFVAESNAEGTDHYSSRGINERSAAVVAGLSE